MGRAARRKHRAQPFGTMFGLELFEDSRLLRMILAQLHYDAVDPPSTSDDPPFPLADVDNPTITNANLVMCVLRQHPADVRDTVIVQTRYFHRDSRDPEDGLDLKRTQHYSIRADSLGDDLAQDFCRFLATDEHFRLCAPPQVYDFAGADIKTAIDAWTKLPFVHSRVMAPDGGVQ